MARFSTLLFVLTAAIALAAGSPVPDTQSTSVAAEGSGYEVGTAAAFADFDDDTLAFEEDEDDVDLDDVDELDDEEDDDDEDVEINSLASRETCNVGPVDMHVVDIVYKTAKARKVSSKVMLATFECGIQESNFNNLNCGDQDSQGVFQQRPSQGWGTVQQIRDVAHATNKFLDGAIPSDKANPGFTAGQLAQSVQRSDYPDRYDKRKAEAESLLNQAKSRYAKASKPKPKSKSKPKPKPKSKASSGVKAPKNRATGTITKGCKKYTTVKKGDICAKLAKAGGISVASFLKINSGVHSNCNNLQIGKAYCVKK